MRTRVILAFFACPSLYLSVSVPVTRFVALTIYPSISICISMSLYVSCLSDSLCLSVSLSLCLSVSFFLSVSLCLSVYPSLCLSVCLSVCLSLCLWLCLWLCLSVCIAWPWEFASMIVLSFSSAIVPGKSISNNLWYWIHVMVLIFDGNSDHIAQAGRNIDLFGEK